MQFAHRLPAFMVACLVAQVAAAEGLKVGTANIYGLGEASNVRLNALWISAASTVGARWAGLSDAAPVTVGASLVGDYYFSAATPGQGLRRSGFRASSGLLIRQPGVSLSELAWSSRSAATFGVPSHLQLSSVNGNLADPGADNYSTLPYLGIGYSGIHPKSGWGFWADVGLVMQSPGNVLGVGRAMSGAQSVEDLVRDLRLSPLVQLGVNYSF